MFEETCYYAVDSVHSKKKGSIFQELQTISRYKIKSYYYKYS